MKVNFILTSITLSTHSPVNPDFGWATKPTINPRMNMRLATPVQIRHFFQANSFPLTFDSSFKSAIEELSISSFMELNATDIVLCLNVDTATAIDLKLKKSCLPKKVFIEN